MPEPGSQSPACPACGQELGHAPNCPVLKQAEPTAAKQEGAAVEEQELPPEYQDRIAPFDADIVIWHRRMDMGGHVSNDSAQSLIEAAGGPPEFSLRVHLIKSIGFGEDKELKHWIKHETNPFPHTKFLFRFADWKKKTSDQDAQEMLNQLGRAEKWPFLQILVDTDGHYEGQEAPPPAEFLSGWPDSLVQRDSKHVYSPEGAVLLAVAITRECAAHPLPQEHTKKDLYKIFVRANRAAFPKIWTTEVPEEPPTAVEESVSKCHPSLTQEARQSYLELVHETEEQERRKAAARNAAERNAEWEKRNAATPDFQELSPEIQQYVRELEGKVSAIEEQHPEFREACDRTINQELQAAKNQLIVTLARHLLEEQETDLRLAKLLKKAGFDESKLSDIKKAIANEDPQPLADTMLKLSQGEESVLERVSKNAFSEYRAAGEALISAMSKYSKDYQHVLAADPKLRFSERAFMGAVMFEEGNPMPNMPKFRAGFNENHLVYPFSTGWDFWRE